MNAVQQTANECLPAQRTVLSSVSSGTPLTRVSLAFVEYRINLYLRFGHPVRELRLDRWRRHGNCPHGRVVREGGIHVL